MDIGHSTGTTSSCRTVCYDYNYRQRDRMLSNSLYSALHQATKISDVPRSYLSSDSTSSNHPATQNESSIRSVKFAVNVYLNQTQSSSSSLSFANSNKICRE
ncbi:4477_t:CDS:2 [Paraglomus occultum]|uniref:4477_t:CDS:1 n=1 Tax=Paraglomus occultum TaxID=144539 RepID=A0A9N9AZG1_9GLOM|nr:4477_t:CDS:2 [Paraglomus occultum]